MPGTPIPVINSTVETPGFGVAPNPLRAEPLESNAGPAISQAGDTLMGIWKAQQAHANAIDVAKRFGAFQADFGNAKVAALNSGQQAPDMIANLQKAGNALMAQHVAGTMDPANPNPPNRAVARGLALAMQDHVSQSMGTFPLDAAERVYHDLDFKARIQVKTAAQAAAAGYSIGGTTTAPIFQDSSEPGGGADLTDHAHAMINGMYPLPARAPENQLFNDQFDQEKAFQRAMLVAQDHPSLADDYLRSPDGTKLTAEQHTAVINAATLAIRRPAEALNAANGNTDAQLTEQFLKQSHDGTLDAAGLENAATHSLISSAHYQQITGYKFMPPGNPSAITAMQHQISTVPDENALETLRGTINGPQNAELYGKGAIPLNAQIENQKRQLQTVEGRQRKQDYDQIKRAYQALPGVPGGVAFYNKFAAVGGLPTMQDITRNAVDDYNSAAFGVHDPAKLRAIREQVLKDNVPDLKSVGLSRDTSKATTPPVMTDDEAKALARSAGLK